MANMPETIRLNGAMRQLIAEIVESLDSGDPAIKVSAVQVVNVALMNLYDLINPEDENYDPEDDAYRRMFAKAILNGTI